MIKNLMSFLHNLLINLTETIFLLFHNKNMFFYRIIIYNGYFIYNILII
jgi:hypothetical protein